MVWHRILSICNSNSAQLACRSASLQEQSAWNSWLLRALAVPWASRSWFDNAKSWVVCREHMALSSSHAARSDGLRDLKMDWRRSVGAFREAWELQIGDKGVSSQFETVQQAMGLRGKAVISTLTVAAFLRGGFFGASSSSLLMTMASSLSSVPFSSASTISLSSKLQVPTFSLIRYSIWWAHSTPGGQSTSPVGLKTLTN